ncbi:MAG: DUF4294 domain-containing protein [Bacteroidetes bacterium]|nr:DUF4294 domain-containing protein [Bacteroidota bacterium]
MKTKNHITANNSFYSGFAFLLVFVLFFSDSFAQETRRRRGESGNTSENPIENKLPSQNTLTSNKNTTQTSSSSNTGKIQGTVMQKVIVGGDTLLLSELQEVVILAPREFKSRLDQVRYNRLMRNVKKVYPYAKLAGEKFREYNELLINETSERKKSALMKQAEEELRESFEAELKKLTITQGIILVKLIDRETQNTTYEILKEFRGVFSAVFWQGLGRLFGYNLKTKYDPKGEDKLIEEIIMMIEWGII